MTDRKFILLTQKTRLEQLVKRYNTIGQAEFYIEHHGGDFSVYQEEHSRYQEALQKTSGYLQKFGRVSILEKEYLSGYLFGEKDILVVLGRDGLVVNALKYLHHQKVIGVNPDISTYDGVLLPFVPEDLPKILPELHKRPIHSVTLACAELNDGQKLYAVNDLFIGQKTHTSARYILSLDGKTETQISSGLIISTGLGSTGWLKSILAGVSGIDRYYGIQNHFRLSPDFRHDAKYLYFSVREPFPSKTTGTEIVFGKISQQMQIISLMPENGVIFSDGMEADFLEFNSGAEVSVKIAEKTGNLVN